MAARSAPPLELRSWIPQPPWILQRARKEFRVVMDPAEVRPWISEGAPRRRRSRSRRERSSLRSITDPIEARPAPWREPSAAEEEAMWISRRHGGETVEPHAVVDLTDPAATVYHANPTRRGSRNYHRCLERER